MSDLFASSAFFGLLLSAGSFELARAVNRKIGRASCRERVCQYV